MYSINIIGSGNMACFIANAFNTANIKICTIYSRNKEQGKLLAASINSTFVENINSIYKDADITFLAISDDAIESISKQTKTNKMLVHCSGILPLDILKKHNSYGVFYPLQTITKNDLPNAQDVPICIEGNNNTSIEILTLLANNISKHVHNINSEQRQYYHLAAVFANNFSNHLFALANGILLKQNISFDLLKPLIAETAKKAIAQTPILNQTGPAKRQDISTINKHLQLLNDDEYTKQVYKVLTQSIINLHNIK